MYISFEPMNRVIFAADEVEPGQEHYNSIRIERIDESNQPPEIYLDFVGVGCTHIDLETARKMSELLAVLCDKKMSELKFL